MEKDYTLEKGGCFVYRKVFIALVILLMSINVAVYAADETVVITADMLEPVVDSITGNLGVLLPVGLTILAVMVGVALIPRIIWKFF